MNQSCFTEPGKILSGPLDVEKLELEVLQLRRDLFDYGRVRGQAKLGLIIAALAAIAAIIALFK